jgi:hypothetical protein
LLPAVPPPLTLSPHPPPQADADGSGLVERAEFIAAAALLLAAPPPGDARRAPRNGHWLAGLAYQLKRPVAQRPALAPLRAACVQSGDWPVLRSALFPTPAARARAAAEARAFLRLPAAPPSAAPPPYGHAPPEFVAAMCERFAALPPAALAKVPPPPLVLIGHTASLNPY